MTDLSDLRREYAARSLDAGDVDADPFTQFRRWFDEATGAGVPEPNAMTLATATREGLPSARVVLLKGLDARGFVFFTNYESRKGVELADNPRAALVFLWHEVERQVRVEGTVERVSAAESDAYFAVRPRASQLGAWASPQSRSVADRAALAASFAEVTARFGEAEPPRPAHWGGYRVIPTALEFWQGRRSRMHDRLVYERSGEGWRLTRLAP
jgi:pyridoxamine 5'-phosphate oxidase